MMVLPSALFILFRRPAKFKRLFLDGYYFCAKRLAAGKKKLGKKDSTHRSVHLDAEEFKF